MAEKIILCGLNGTGKSTLGNALAERLGYRFIDVEKRIFYNAFYSLIIEVLRIFQEFCAIRAKFRRVTVTALHLRVNAFNGTELVKFDKEGEIHKSD